MASTHLAQQLNSTVELRPLAGLLQVLNLVPLTHAQLDERIDSELAQNPMLERAPGIACPTCGRHIHGNRCTRCARPTRVEDTAAPTDELATLACCEVNPRCRAAMPLILAHLTGRGLLDGTVDEIAQLHHLPKSTVQECIRAIRAVGPPGIATCCLTELLAAQAESLVRSGACQPWVVNLVRDHLDLVAEHDAAVVADMYGVNEGDADAAFAFIATRLRPDLDVGVTTVPQGPPDVIVTRDETGRLQAEVADSQSFGLRVATIPDEYLADKAAAAWLRGHLEAANGFVHQLDARAAVLKRVVAAALEYQSDYLELGPQRHKRLTRSALAKDLDLCVSTVSRAVKDKRLRLPDGRIIDMDCLFGTSVSVRTELQNLAAEQACSDRQLAELLAARGYRISRRTVAKYRAELGLTSSRQRTTLR